jgi:hypothetical protein
MSQLQLKHTYFRATWANQLHSCKAYTVCLVPVWHSHSFEGQILRGYKFGTDTDQHTHFAAISLAQLQISIHISQLHVLHSYRSSYTFRSYKFGTATDQPTHFAATCMTQLQISKHNSHLHVWHSCRSAYTLHSYMFGTAADQHMHTFHIYMLSTARDQRTYFAATCLAQLQISIHTSQLHVLHS